MEAESSSIADSFFARGDPRARADYVPETARCCRWTRKMSRKANTTTIAANRYSVARS